MKFQTSTEPNALIDALSQQKPRVADQDSPGRYERTITFIHPDDAEKAKSVLAELLPEPQRPEIKLETAISIDTGTHSYRLTVPSLMLPVLRKGLRKQTQGESTSASGSFVSRLDARSRGDELRQMPYDPEHPETSVNTFMGKLAVLEYAFDLCERLDYARDHHSGNKHKYYASTGSYGLRFDTKADADKAKEIFGALIQDGDAIHVDEQVISHKSFFWLKVPGNLASSILSEANSLARMGAQIAQQFEAGHLEQATKERDALLTIVEDMGLGSTHEAEQMTHDVLAQAHSRTR